MLKIISLVHVFLNKAFSPFFNPECNFQPGLRDLKVRTCFLNTKRSNLVQNASFVDCENFQDFEVVRPCSERSGAYENASGAVNNLLKIAGTFFAIGTWTVWWREASFFCNDRDRVDHGRASMRNIPRWDAAGLGNKTHPLQLVGWSFAFRPIKIWNSDLVVSKQPSRRVWFCQGLFSPGANKHLWLEEWRFFSRLSGTTTHRIVLFNWTWQWDGLVYWVFPAFWLTWCHSLWRGFQGIHGSSCRWPCSTCRCNRGVHCWSADA